MPTHTHVFETALDRTVANAFKNAFGEIARDSGLRYSVTVEYNTVTLEWNDNSGTTAGIAEDLDEVVDNLDDPAYREIIAAASKELAKPNPSKELPWNPSLDS